MHEYHVSVPADHVSTVPDCTSIKFHRPACMHTLYIIGIIMFTDKTSLIFSISNN